MAKPIKILTGSTNISVVGIFGHSNAAHIVDDPAIAKEYFDYWTKLSTNPAKAAFVPVVNATPARPYCQPTDKETSAYSTAPAAMPICWILTQLRHGQCHAIGMRGLSVQRR